MLAQNGGGGCGVAYYVGGSSEQEGCCQTGGEYRRDRDLRRRQLDDIIPTLRERIAREITKKGISGAPLQGGPDTVMAEAREKAANTFYA